MNNNSSREKITIIWFYFINVKGNWPYLAEKNSWAGAISAMKIYKFFKSIIIKILLKDLLYCEQQNHLISLKVSS